MQKQNPSSLRATTVRASLVDWIGHEEIKPYFPDFGLLINVAGSILMPVARRPARSKWCTTEPLGRFLTGMAMGVWDGALEGEGVERLPGGFTVVENPGFRRIMGLDAVDGQ
ncbi:hypothetical protein N657DRAFT_647745 [Parathielavia appendiculata]|uniref:Uncharacterized protein n=1 Tax=Parathielavia appendiculata TaxID=2587402 RepID=A0AAN6Z1M7_9PEZI|nr:hypothetical protein N657DRAFT_647745 [Parathielavia appendiculata]